MGSGIDFYIYVGVYGSGESVCVYYHPLASPIINQSGMGTKSMSDQRLLNCGQIEMKCLPDKMRRNVKVDFLET